MSPIGAAIVRLVTGANARWVGVAPVRADGAIPQRVYFANHTSHLDAPVIWASLPHLLRKRTRPIAGKDYWERGPLRRFMSRHLFRAVLIERKHVTKSSNPMLTMDAVLSEGQSLIIFPEGTRSDDADGGEIGEFRGGLWHLARKHPEIEFVPVHLENLNRILPKGTLIVVPLLAAVTFGAPVRVEADESKSEFLERARRAVAELHPESEVA